MPPLPARTRPIACIAALLLAQLPVVAGADAGEASDAPPGKPGPLPVAVAAVPGLLASGAGHWVMGDSRTGRRLIALKGIGAAALASGGGYIWATGASRRGTGLAAAVMVAGGSLFFGTWLADIYGAAGGRTGRPRVVLPRLELDAGWMHVRDPQFSYDQFAFLDAELGLGAFRVRPSAEVAIGADNQRFRLEVARRLRGPGGSAPSGDGSFFEIGGAASFHRYGDEDHFSVIGAELFASGRYDLARIGESLTGSFFELELGLGGERVDYAVEGSEEDWNDLLLGRCAFGMYLGGRGEAALFYDHRRDGYAGGLSPWDKNGSGFLGSTGVTGFFYFTDRIGVRAEYAMGAAHVAQLGLRIQMGDGS